LAHTRGSHAVDPDDRVPGGFDAHFGRRQRHPYPQLQQHHARRRCGGPCVGHFPVRPRSRSAASSDGSNRGIREYAVPILRPVPHRLRCVRSAGSGARTRYARAPRRRVAGVRRDPAAQARVRNRAPLQRRLRAPLSIPGLSMCCFVGLLYTPRLRVGYPAENRARCAWALGSPIVARAEIRALIEAAIDRLPLSLRTVFVMRAIEQMTIKEASAALDIPPQTVKTRFFRARRLLRRALEVDLGSVLDDVFAFAGRRCEELRRRVLARFGLLAPDDAKTS